MTRHPVPAAIAVVANDDGVNLVRRNNEPDAGLWGFPGGKVAEMARTQLLPIVTE